MYSVNFNNAMINLLSPDKRSSTIVALNKPASDELQIINNDLILTYKQYQSIPSWDVTMTYMTNVKVFYKKAIYKSLLDSNIGKDPVNNPDFWIIISPNFMGVDTRLKINSQKLVFEFGLNLWFNTIFRQLPLVSDIYIKNNSNLNLVPFVAGFNESQSSKVTTISSDGFIGINYVFTPYYGFSIYIPIAIYNSIGTTSQESESIIRNFSNKYIISGTYYNIITY